MAALTHSYGWIADLPDHRDLLLAAPRQWPWRTLPPAVDLRSVDTIPVYDQGQLGSCTANAIAAALAFTLHKQGLPNVDPSRLYIYFKERQMEGTINQDGGAQIRDGMKVVAGGFVPEAEWPYDVTKFTTPPAPIAQLDQDARRDRVIKYQRVLRDFGMRACLAGGLPFVMGISVYESFEQATDGHVPMPSPSEQLLGGHAILCEGYTSDQRYIFRNSWGANWGEKGFGYLPAAYLNQGGLSSDFWTVQAAVES